MNPNRFNQQFIDHETYGTDEGFTGKANDLRGLSNVRIVVNAPNDDSAAGTFKLQASEDDALVRAAVLAGDPTGDSRGARWFDVEIPDGALDGSGFTDPAGDTVLVTWDGTADMLLAFNLEHPYSWMRLVYAATGTGGAANFIDAVAGGR